MHCAHLPGVGVKSSETPNVLCIIWCNLNLMKEVESVIVYNVQHQISSILFLDYMCGFFVFNKTCINKSNHSTDVNI